MPPLKKKIPVTPGQPPKECSLVEITATNEKWSEATLADGSTIRVKPVILEVWLIEGEKDQDGGPVYYVKAQNVMGTRAGA